MVSKSFCGPALLCLAACLPLLWSQGSERLTVGTPGKLAGQRNAAVQTRIPIAILDGFHVNSDKPTDEYMIPLTVTWTALGALEGGKVTFPKASLEKYEFAPKPLSVFTGNIELTADFKVSANAPAGPGVATGKLRYQACSKSACFAPKTVEINLPYQVR